MSRWLIQPSSSPSLAVLNAFCESARRGSFVSAARGLAITPSAVSKAVASLEAQWGVALFRRTGRECGLTPAGEVMYEQVNAVLRQLAQVNRPGF